MMPNITHSTGFRLILLTAGIFSLCVIVLGSVVFFDVRASLEHQLRDRIHAEQRQLMGDYREDGLEELRHDISERRQNNPGGRLLYFITAPDGRTIFDTIATAEQTEGWQHIHDGDTPLLLYMTPLQDGYWLGIAADKRDSHDTENVIIHAGGIALLALLAIALFAGVVISRIFIRQIDTLAQAAKNIGDGNLTQRLPVRGTGDELDQLSLIINRMMDRIQALVQNLQHVSANIAHDLRTPLGQVRQKLEAAQDTASTEQQPHVAAALTHLDQALNTFSALLRIAEIESGTRHAAFRDIDLAGLVNNMGDAFAPVAEDAQQMLCTDIRTQAHIHADQDLMTQLCVNLIENAIRHAGSGATITLQLTDLPAGAVLLRVADTGKGAPADMLAQLTTPFYRAEKSRTSRGNGLGLSLVKAIADLHGMRLELHDNAPGLRVDLVIPRKP